MFVGVVKPIPAVLGLKFYVNQSRSSRSSSWFEIPHMPRCVVLMCWFPQCHLINSGDSLDSKSCFQLQVQTWAHLGIKQTRDVKKKLPCTAETLRFPSSELLTASLHHLGFCSILLSIEKSERSEGECRYVSTNLILKQLQDVLAESEAPDSRSNPEFLWQVAHLLPRAHFRGETDHNSRKQVQHTHLQFRELLLCN